MTDHDEAPTVVRCWCCPPNVVIAGMACEWPNCVCGDLPDPAEEADHDA